ncbi:phage shock protein operon transcriptional activator [Novispirillum itersonii]|uniref:Psp operon transcriptional activator n=1 Tax=Novispirillum itersonii TaxID=189 RepID=A0A7W9ZHW8_NOVIT|nr:phage shock protein operon transcriptional activator [Novispirillum itersonii]MBB6211791.1 psp operon transcriptional activator [Novispirillum itersonii]
MRAPLSAPIGEDPAFLSMLDKVRRLAPLNRPVLVVGERGVGKELASERLHYLSGRWDGPVVKVNCAALPETLLESELFGHEAGAFTGAQKRRAGRFERAHRGTLILDEIASASLQVQEKLLRAIEYGDFERVGGVEQVSVDVRVIACANVDLPALARDGKFRADLLDRLAFDVVTVPALRQRPEDIPVLAQHFALRMTQELGRSVFAGFDPAVLAQLRAHAWPGNVRELKNVVERAVYQTPEDQPVAAVVLDPFAADGRPGATLNGPEPEAPPPVAAAPAGPAGPVPFTEAVTAYERQLLEAALRACDNQQTKGAEWLGLGYHQFRRLLKKHGVG